MRHNQNMLEDGAWIVEAAKEEGFDLCGVVRAQQFPELERFGEWLERGYAGEMAYLKDPRRREPALVLDNLRSVIVCALTYNTAHPYSTQAASSNAVGSDEPRGWISRYAWGDDYHEVLWSKLNALVSRLKERFREPFAARAYADTGPVAERILAKHAGLGWLGKNTLLLNKSLGSWFFLGVILTSLDLTASLGPSEMPPPDLCGKCRRCLDACPTEALVEPYVLDAQRCISYLTIELRSSIPEEFREAMGWHVYGCDICQDVCPFNRRAPVSEAECFQMRTFPAIGHSEAGDGSLSAGMPDPQRVSLLMPRLEWLAGMNEEDFRTAFRHSAMKRTKWAGLVRNACIALGNCRIKKGSVAFERIVQLLQRLSESDRPTISESAHWALSRIQPSE
jgi:epoxyqueuosine reductase